MLISSTLEKKFKTKVFNFTEIDSIIVFRFFQNTHIREQP